MLIDIDVEEGKNPCCLWTVKHRKSPIPFQNFKEKLSPPTLIKTKSGNTWPLWKIQCSESMTFWEGSGSDPGIRTMHYGSGSLSSMAFEMSIKNKFFFLSLFCLLCTVGTFACWSGSGYRSVQIITNNYRSRRTKNLRILSESGSRSGSGTLEKTLPLPILLERSCHHHMSRQLTQS